MIFLPAPYVLRRQVDLVGVPVVYHVIQLLQVLASVAGRGEVALVEEVLIMRAVHLLVQLEVAIVVLVEQVVLLAGVTDSFPFLVGHDLVLS